MLDYDKKFLVKSWDNLTFDGSSIRGFTAQRESDLRLGIDWSAFYWAPSDIFGTGKVLVFGEVIDKDGTAYSGDIRGVLKGYANDLYTKNGYTLNAANEIEGFPFQGTRTPSGPITRPASSNTSTPAATIIRFPAIRCASSSTPTAEVQRAMGFENEKDHPEVAPSQFEINYSYADVVTAADQIQLYKLICRQVATQDGLHRVLPAEAGRRRERQRHAHERLDHQGRQEHFLGSEGRREDEQLRLGVCRSHSDPRQRYLPAAELERKLLSPPRSAL